MQSGKSREIGGIAVYKRATIQDQYILHEEQRDSSDSTQRNRGSKTIPRCGNGTHCRKHR